MDPEKEHAMRRKANIPVLKADKIYGHAAQEKGHERLQLSGEAPAGSKTRQSRTEPPKRAKQQRKSARSGTAGGANPRRISRSKIGG
jgi:hypothetical protein